MPAKMRIKTTYPGVYYIEGFSRVTGKRELIFYIRYRKNGKLIEEKAGRQFQDRMTPAKAQKIRMECIEGNRLPRKEIRYRENAEKKPWANKNLNESEEKVGQQYIDRITRAKAERIHPDSIETTQVFLKNTQKHLRSKTEDTENFRTVKRYGEKGSQGPWPAPGPMKKQSKDLKGPAVDLSESEESYRVIFENANDVITLLDLKGNVLDVNEAIRRIYGYNRYEVLGKNVFDLGLAPVEKLRSLFEKVKLESTGQAPSTTLKEIEITCKDGSKVLIEATTRALMKNGKPIGFFTIERDVTERKRMEQALKESEETARALLNATTDAVMMIDPEGYILDLNRAYARVFGRKVTELVGLSLWKMIPNDVKDLRDYVKRVIRTGRSIRFEKEYRGMWSDNVIYPVEGTRKNISRVAIFSHDITKLKKAEEELLQHRDHLERLVKERTLNLEQTNTALKVLLKRREEDKTELEDKMILNVNELIRPYLDGLKLTGLNENQRSFVDVIEYNLANIIAPFVKALSSRYYNLTRTEIRIANLIKQGKTTKEIADQLNTSLRTIDNHRYRIRKKLGINQKKINLAAYLLSIN